MPYRPQVIWHWASGFSVLTSCYTRYILPHQTLYAQQVPNPEPRGLGDKMVSGFRFGISCDKDYPLVRVG